MIKILSLLISFCHCLGSDECRNQHKVVQRVAEKCVHNRKLWVPATELSRDIHLAIFQVIPGDCSFSILQWQMKQFRPVLSKQVLKLQKLKYSSILFFLEINPYNYYCNSNALNAHWMLTLYTLIKIQSEVGFIIPSVQTMGLKCGEVKSLCHHTLLVGVLTHIQI